MIKKIHIQNYKSIERLDFELGRVNIIVGENGAGKSNILDAITLAYAAAQDKLDNESLLNRGFRVTDPSSLKSGFDPKQKAQNIIVHITNDADFTYKAELSHDNERYSNWKNDAYCDIENMDFQSVLASTNDAKELMASIEDRADKAKTKTAIEDIQTDLARMRNLITKNMKFLEREDTLKIICRDIYMVYTLNYAILSDVNIKGTTIPIDYNGGGLLDYVSYLHKEKPELYKRIEEKLSLFDWFDGLELPDMFQNTSSEDNRVFVLDRFLNDGIKHIDYRCTSEGFLYTLFIFTVMVGDKTPKFIAIENIDTALNPKLCKRVIEEIVILASEYNRQVIFTTHNPLVLDGIDLSDPTQRIFVAYRNIDGKTKLNQIQIKNNQLPTVSNSVAFSKGYFGGLTRGI